MKTFKHGERSVEIGRRNRNKILNALLKESLTFSKLGERVGLSSKTLSNHLKSLLSESLVKREIQGKYVVYVVATPETVQDMRKTFRNELDRLRFTYSSCLSKPTKALLNEVDKALEKSVTQPIKILRKTIPLPKGIKEGTRITQDSNLYEKPRFEKPKKSKTRGRRKKG